jgi:hypothetical protein
LWGAASVYDRRVSEGRPSEGDTKAEADSIRAQYEAHGAEAYYQSHAGGYTNPHEPEVRHAIRLAVQRWTPDLSHVLDLAAGSGEATLALRDLASAGVEVGEIDGCDPYLFEQYERRTGRPAERFSFGDVAAGALAGRTYSLIVCSFALHLAEPSRLPGVCQQLSQVTPALLVITPHKRPVIREEWGWHSAGELVWARVRCRFYRTSAET